MRRVVHIPRGDGEALVDPPLDEWQSLIEATARAASGWSVPIAGEPLAVLRRRARAEALALASAACRRLGIPNVETLGASRDLVMTGHQPELFHPGVWAKHFAVDTYAKRSGAVAVEAVVDTDRVGVLALRAPCVPAGASCRDIVVHEDRTGTCYACAPPPSTAMLERFTAALEACLERVPDEGVRARARRFVVCLQDAAARSRTLAEALVAARRAFEADAGTRYLELFVSEQSATEAFIAFAAHTIADAPRFAEIFNDEVVRYRARTGERSAAHPFPELSVEGGAIEVPFWALAEGRRARMRYEPASGRLAIDGVGRIEVGREPAQVASGLRTCGLRVVPKAVALTMFERLFVADLFVHGVGGARYEAVTDAVVERWLGIAPPPYAVVSLTMRWPGASAVADDELQAVRRRLREAEHNPDRLLAEAVFESVAERQAAEALAAEKRALRERFADPAADKKALNARVRELNVRLREAVRPVIESLQAELSRLEAVQAQECWPADREVSFPFFDAIEVSARIQ